MEQRTDYLALLSLVFLLYASAKFPSSCEGRNTRHIKSYTKSFKHPRGQPSMAVRRLQDYNSLDSFSVGSPFSLPPFDDVMGPYPSPQDYPPFCVYPPQFPIPPMPPSGTFPIQSPPPPPPPYTNPPALVPNPPEYIPSPPEAGPGTPMIGPGTPIIMPGPPAPLGFEPIPPGAVPSPPVYIPGPPEFVPGPPIFLPPVIYPPPNVLPNVPPPATTATLGLWCVAKPTVPDPIIQEAMSYACGSGADCDAIQPNGSCYQPDTLIAHASFAFNSYWQRTRDAGGTCDFGGTAMLITTDPSYDGCHFMIT